MRPRRAPAGRCYALAQQAVDFMVGDLRQARPEPDHPDLFLGDQLVPFGLADTEDLERVTKRMGSALRPPSWGALPFMLGEVLGHSRSSASVRLRSYASS